VNFFNFPIEKVIKLKKERKNYINDYIRKTGEKIHLFLKIRIRI